MFDPGPIPAFLDLNRSKPIIWTFTMLKCYRDVCPHQAQQVYVEKNIPWVETPQKKWGNDVHAAMETRIRAGKPLPLEMQKWEPIARCFDGKGIQPELKLGITREGKPCDFFDKTGQVWGRGTIDVPLIGDDRAYIADHKTGNVREDPFELEVHAVLLKAKYPQLQKVVGQYLWLKEDRPGPIHDLSNFESTWHEIERIVAMIEADRSKGEFEKRRGKLCHWCEVKACEHNSNPNISR